MSCLAQLRIAIDNTLKQGVLLNRVAQPRYKLKISPPRMKPSNPGSLGNVLIMRETVTPTAPPRPPEIQPRPALGARGLTSSPPLPIRSRSATRPAALSGTATEIQVCSWEFTRKNARASKCGSSPANEWRDSTKASPSRQQQQKKAMEMALFCSFYFVSILFLTGAPAGGHRDDRGHRRTV